MNPNMEEGRPTPGTVPATPTTLPVPSAPGEPPSRLDRLQRLDPATAMPGAPDGLQAAAAYAPEDWALTAPREAVALAASRRPFTVDTLRRRGVPEPDTFVRWGALFSLLQRRGIITATGWASRHGNDGERAVRVWTGTEELDPEDGGRGD